MSVCNQFIYFFTESVLNCTCILEKLIEIRNYKKMGGFKKLYIKVKNKKLSLQANGKQSHVI